MPLPLIASLWIGSRLSYLEQVCLRSFVDHGHRVRLYSFGEVGGVPEGVQTCDAAAILPHNPRLFHGVSGSPAVFADAWRYHLLAAVPGALWVDADVLCMQPWDIAGGFVFGWEKPGKLVCNAVLGLPPGSETLRNLLNLVSDEHPVPPWAAPDERARLHLARDAGRPVHVSNLAWGVWGPAALTHFLTETGEIDHARPQEAFYPVAFRDRRLLISADEPPAFGPETLGVHLWNRRLSRRLLSHDAGIPRKGSFLAEACALHGIDPAAAPIPDRWTPDAGGGPPLPLMRYHQTPARQRRAAQIESAGERRAPRLPLPAEPPETGRILAMTCMKNEAPFILEWIAYNQSIGVTDFLVYTNECTDQTVPMLDRLEALGHLRRRDNPYDPATEKPQHAALKHASNDIWARAADWTLCIDVDEFLNIHVGDGTIPDFLRAAHYPNVASFTWKFFGNSGVAAFQDCPVTEQFLNCAPEVPGDSWLGWGFKSMIHRAAPFARLGVHRPLDADDTRRAEIRWVNGSGREMPQGLHHGGWHSTEKTLGYKLATLNHYVLRSADSFLVKRERGRINHTRQDQGLTYWRRRNHGSERDERILARLPAMHDHLSALKSDPELARLHAEAVDWHRARADALKARPDYARLYAAITAPNQIDAMFVSKQPPPPESPKGPALPRLDPPPGLAPATSPALSEMAAAARARGGFVWEGGETALAYLPGSDRLVVSFDGLADIREDAARWPADYAAIQSETGASVLGVIALGRHWHRTAEVSDGLTALADARYFDAFRDVLFFGASMGGYAALAYARTCRAARVLALAPQTTLDPAILPEDDRWAWTRALDWSGPFADGADLARPRRATVVTDPRDPDEVRQVARLSDKVRMIHAPFTGRHIGTYLGQMDAKGRIIALALEGRLNTRQFRKIWAGRAGAPKYMRSLALRAETTGRPDRALALCDAAMKTRRAPRLKALRDELRRSLALAAE